jgi:two-component system, NtrC family, response regulator AtoC
VDVRVITATNRDLLQEVHEGKFRDDLYYRLNVINIHMPPLRERKDDIPLLINHFLTKRRGRSAEPPRMTEAAMQALLEYDWPGNVRQLENTIERAVVLAQGRLIGPEHLLLADQSPATDVTLQQGLDRLLDYGGSLETMLAELRTRLVGLALERFQGDRSAAARALGVSEAELGA